MKPDRVKMDAALQKIGEAAQLLGQASLAMTEINPLAGSVPEIQELNKIMKRLIALTAEISKLPV